MANRPYILVYMDPLLTYLLASVPSLTQPKDHEIKVYAFFLCFLLLMEEIPNNHLGCINLVNTGTNYIPTGAGFLPSTVLNMKSPKV